MDIILYEHYILTLAAGWLIAWTVVTKLLAHTIVVLPAGIDRL